MNKKCVYFTAEYDECGHPDLAGTICHRGNQCGGVVPSTNIWQEKYLELEIKVEKMKCCQNCKYGEILDEGTACHIHKHYECFYSDVLYPGTEKNTWELRDKE